MGEKEHRNLTDHRRPYEDSDPTEGLSLRAFAQRLACSVEAVQARELAGEIFSVVRPSRATAREYPAFQAWTGIEGKPLELLLKALGRPSGPEAYAFFTSPLHMLAGLTAIECLLGFASRPMDSDGVDFLSMPRRERMNVLIEAAHTYAASLQA